MGQDIDRCIMMELCIKELHTKDICMNFIHVHQHVCDRHDFSLLCILRMYMLCSYIDCYQKWGNYFLKVTRYLLLLPTTKIFCYS